MQHAVFDSTIYFRTYEEREEAFRSDVFSLIPRKYLGPKLFWKDFKRISLDNLSQLIEKPIAYITSNPRDCLAFGTPWQVLTAAHLCTLNTQQSDIRSVEQLADDFGVYETLFQPIRTLSGGETVKLALAKAYFLSAFTQRLTIASPFSWLSRDNSFYFERLYKHYFDIGLPVKLLALNGEDSSEPHKTSGIGHQSADEPVDFSILLKNVVISLGSSLNPLQEQKTFAKVSDIEGNLRSPCLIVGKNGQGKSLIAKMLCGAIPFQGIAKIEAGANAGPARLLFQDVITQTLLRSFNGITASASAVLGQNPLDLYDRLSHEYRFNLNLLGGQIAESDFCGENEFRSLLEVKALLVAVRLSGLPSALILDEPDWGLSRDSAIALVLAILKIASESGIPVLIISHKPWWHKITNSIIRVQRTAKETDKDGNNSFQIKLTHTV